MNHAEKAGFPVYDPYPETFFEGQDDYSPRVSVYQGLDWVSGQCLCVSEPTQSVWGPQTKFLKSDEFPQNDHNDLLEKPDKLVKARVRRL